ncbi:MAG: hypothetical protein GY765_23830 [bacterium]|nr:hypothetical protein [bacterium]
MPVTQAPTTTGQIAGHLFKVLRGNDNLVFANSRANVETYTDRLSRLSESRNCPNEFFPHHGSLSRAIRTSVEKRLKEGKLPTSAVCTSTLEMGIDIGSVKSIAQVGCPFSISSLRQRLGRSGRKDGDPSILRIYIEEEEVTQRTHHEDMLRGCLFQSAAMTELLIRKWLEPPDGNILHLSTLVQQLLSLIAQYGGIKAQNAWKALCLLGPFNRIDEDAFVLFLRNLGKRELLSQTHDGDLVLGHIGERIVNHYSFYSAFVTEEEYRLIANGKTLGTMPISNPIFIGAYLIFAGKRWEITKVDDEQKVILLRPSRGGKPPGFSSSGGQVHDEIRKEMLRLYQSDNVPVYLDKEAAALFREGRDNFMRLQLNHRRIVPAGEDTIIFPWVGDKVLNTLHLLFKNQEIKTERHDFSLTVEGRTPDEVIALLEDIFKAGPVYPLHLASIVDAKKREKYDHYLPDALLCAEYASRFIDINGALECIESLIK